jgi:hypothetical protein
MMSSSSSHDSYDTLINLRDKLTRLNGVITPEDVDNLEDELGGIFTVAKTHHYEDGQKYGHLASAIPEAKYRLVIANDSWTHTVPTDSGAYSPKPWPLEMWHQRASSSLPNTISSKRATATT